MTTRDRVILEELRRAAEGEDRRIGEAEWERDHASNDDAPRGWGE